ncbi:MAG: class I SAM-dependent rRNA methyltransferase [Thermoflexales bacterium]|nr:class I SAM-dependent rRNA methyltransferase [Thermoflexales bacterium]
MSAPASALAQVVVRSGRDRSVRQRHPRLFASAIKEILGRPKDGELVDVTDNHGVWLARGVINQQAQIAIRLLTWSADEGAAAADWPGLWQARVRAAIAQRTADPNLRDTDARRLVFGESDGLPGLVVDDYAGHLVMQLSTLAATQWRGPALDALQDALHPACVIEREDDDRMRHERPDAKPGPAFAVVRGAAPEGPVVFREGGLRFEVDLRSGQKTGYYLDQRENRARVAAYCRGATVLNAFAFSGGFAAHALAAGAASVINLDSSAEALRLAERTMALNGFEARATSVEADAFERLRAWRAEGRRFDVVIVDPPKFAHHPGQVERAARAYKDLNRIALALVAPGGVLATFSCSGVVDAALFQKILFSAALESGRDAQVVERLTQSSDHPVALTFPESEYLKGLILRVP